MKKLLAVFAVVFIFTAAVAVMKFAAWESAYQRGLVDARYPTEGPDIETRWGDVPTDEEMEAIERWRAIQRKKS